MNFARWQKNGGRLGNWHLVTVQTGTLVVQNIDVRPVCFGKGSGSKQETLTVPTTRILDVRWCSEEETLPQGMCRACEAIIRQERSLRPKREQLTTPSISSVP